MTAREGSQLERLDSRARTAGIVTSTCFSCLLSCRSGMHHYHIQWEHRKRDPIKWNQLQRLWQNPNKKRQGRDGSGEAGSI